jgi:ATP-dependent DNA helicase RecG
MIPLPNHPIISEKTRTLKGVGPQIEAILAGRGGASIAELLSLMPVKYQDLRRVIPISQLNPGDEVLISGVVTNITEGRFPSNGRRYFEIVIREDDAELAAIWFSFPLHLRRTIKRGQSMILFGLVQSYKTRLQTIHPEIIGREAQAVKSLVRPVYPEIDGIKPGVLRRIMKAAGDKLAGVPKLFPDGWPEKHGFTDPVVSMKTLHDPPANHAGPLPRPEESRAWRSLAFTELLLLQTTLARSRARIKKATHGFESAKKDLTREFLAGLGFRLTNGQHNAIQEITHDMAAPGIMNRLLQGDVGCGKTVVAFAAAFLAAGSGFQVALMVPTEVLARQHFQSLAPQAERLGVTIDLLTGSLNNAEQKRVREGLTSGRTGIVIGTHALLSTGVGFSALGLVIIDEQHRFGVAQRLVLRNQPSPPDMLVMTATPIPRSLAMTLYGDLDLTVINDHPHGRKNVTTEVYLPEERERAYVKLLDRIQDGGQAYVIAPRIETRAADGHEEDSDLESVYRLHEFLGQRIPETATVGLIHGRMKNEEQQQALTAFRNGEIKVLVATTVVEVGVDVPEAVVMLIEGAHRLGLAQLHQLRGRIGRGGRQSVCLVIGDGGEEGRLGLLARIDDGFKLAEEDLKLRGPGDLTGFKQAGLPSLTWARLPRDVNLLIKANEIARELIENDPELDAPAFQFFRDAIDRLDERIRVDLAEVG